jgi:hypothetical protein
VVVAPEKVVCVGLNYRTHVLHVLEMGRELPSHSTLFSKCARALVGAYDDVTLPAASTQMDWEVATAGPRVGLRRHLGFDPGNRPVYDAAETDRFPLGS